LLSRPTQEAPQYSGAPVLQYSNPRLLPVCRCRCGGSRRDGAEISAPSCSYRPVTSRPRPSIKRIRRIKLQTGDAAGGWIEKVRIPLGRRREDVEKGVLRIQPACAPSPNLTPSNSETVTAMSFPSRRRPKPGTTGGELVRHEARQAPCQASWRWWIHGNTSQGDPRTLQSPESL